MMKNLIRTIIKIPTIYARLLNTLSLLEYMGARKIIRSQAQHSINQKILAHAAEELRHAQILKKAALKIAPELCDSYAPYSLLCSCAAVYYFHSIDYAVRKKFGQNNSWECYLYTTYLIERRAIQFYSIFDEVLIEQRQPTLFRGILAEEKRHLDDITAGVAFDATIDDTLQIIITKEESAFKNLLQIIQKTISQDKQYLLA